ncbi:MAG: YebC/PmpR family DNA-binding transcriptional regulator [Bacteroidales bacterium]
MGRAFEFRKERKFKRWGNMARTFTRIGKEITIAAKQGGADPAHNPRLRTLISTAHSENMPKANVERAIKNSYEKDVSDYKEIIYEGYGPHGIAFLIETATNNNNRTVANIRSYFTKHGGSLGTQGSVEFMFDRKCVFKMKPGKELDLDELELDLIDFGGEEVFIANEKENIIGIYGAFESFGNIQTYIEDHGYELVSGQFVRFANIELIKLQKSQREGLDGLISKLEEDEDVLNIYHTLDTSDDENDE